MLVISVFLNPYYSIKYLWKGDVSICEVNSSPIGILDTRYEVLTLIKQDDKGSVFLVLHRMSGLKRIVKKVAAGSVYRGCLLREAAILKSISHKNIPSLIDIEEDECFIYLVEEYIEGETIYNFIKNNGLPDFEVTVYYVTKLAELLKYLHLEKELKVCHLDIQPKNIIIYKDKLYLIDFGNGILENDYNKCAINMATDGFAPKRSHEQIPEKNMENGMKQDVYGLCAVFCFMLTGKSEPGQDFEKILDERNVYFLVGNMLKTVLKTQNAANSYDTEQVLDVLREITKSYGDKNKDKNKKQYIISVAGVTSGAGATHMALYLTAALSAIGKKALYEENNMSNLVRKMAKYNDEIQYQDGFFIKERCKMKPWYDENVVLVCDEEYIVRDEGVLDEASDYGQIIFVILNDGVLGMTALEEKKYIIKEYLKQKKTVLFGMNRGKGKTGELLFDTKLISIPQLDNPFCVSREEADIVERIIETYCSQKEIQNLNGDDKKGKKKRWKSLLEAAKNFVCHSR